MKRTFITAKVDATTAILLILGSMVSAYTNSELVMDDLKIMIAKCESRFTTKWLRRF